MVKTLVAESSQSADEADLQGTFFLLFTSGKSKGEDKQKYKQTGDSLHNTFGERVFVLLNNRFRSGCNVKGLRK